MDKKLLDEFFLKRFNRKPESDLEYYKEWEMRFKTGHPETWMDSMSLKIYKKLKSNKKSPLNNTEPKTPR